MRNIFTFSTLFFCLVCKAQVSLKDGTNTIIGTYTNIATAYAAIPATITQAYIIEIDQSYSSASETFPINFTNKAGASSANTITIRPSAGATGVNITSSFSGGGTFKLTNADFIIFDGRPGGTGTAKELTITNTNTASNSAQIELIDGASDNVVRYCNIVGAFSSNSTRGIYLGGLATGSTSGNSNNLFEYCYFTGSRNMINASGSSTAAFFGDNNIIRGCEFVNPRFAGIWIQGGYSNFTIDSCKMHSPGTAGHSSTGAFGILVDFQNGALNITRNYISINNGTYTTKVRAISLRSTNTSSTVLLANNFISLTDANATSATVGAIEFGDNNLDDPFSVNAYYNTIRIGGTHTNGTSGSVLSAAFIFTKTYAAHVYDIANNIVINERSGPSGTIQAAYWIPAAGNLGTRTLDYNTYNITGENFAVINTTTYNGFVAYQGAVGSNETNSNTETVQVVSNTDLHLSGSSLGNNNLAALPIPSIVIDADGQARGNIPYRGADEAVGYPLPVVLTAFSASSKNYDVLLSWKTSSESNTLRYDVERSFTNSGFSAIGNVSAAGNSSSMRYYSLLDRDVMKLYNGRDIFYRLKIIDKDGRIHYSGTVLVRTGGIRQNIITVYPNPFNTTPNVSLNVERAGATRILLTDVSGRQLMNTTLTLTEGIHQLQLPVLNHAGKGLYYLQVSNNEGTATKTLIKQ